MNVNIGAYATAANLLDEVATVPGAKGIMLIFDDFLAGLDTFGQKTQPLMSCRAIGLRRPEAPRAITRPGSCGRAKAALVSWIRTSPGCDLIGAHGRDRRLDGDGRRFDPTAAADHPGCSPPRGLPISRG